MLEVKDLYVNYGAVEAIKGISITVQPGEIVTLIGANGAGKTTTLHTISGLVKAKSGSITYNAVSYTHLICLRTFHDTKRYVIGIFRLGVPEVL